MTASDLAPAGVDQWVLRPRPRDGAALRLVCVPYAGGGAAAYHAWPDLLPSTVDIWVLRLPGRDARIQEPPRTDLTGLARDAATALAQRLTEPFALFGHSLGAWIAFELARVLRDRWGLRPAYLGVSARYAPQLPAPHGPIHHLPEEEFLQILDRRFGAIPAAIRADRELRALYLPTLRADTAMLETYRYHPGPPLQCPISAFGGTEDREFGPDGLGAWWEHTTGGFALTMFGGDHFYLGPRRAELLATLGADLSRALCP